MIFGSSTSAAKKYSVSNESDDSLLDERCSKGISMTSNADDAKMDTDGCN